MLFRHCFFSLALLLATCAHGWADPGTQLPVGPLTEVQHSAQGMELTGAHGVIAIQILAPDLIRVRAARTREELANGHSWALADRTWAAVSCSYRKTDSDVDLQTSDLRVAVEWPAGRIRFYDVHSGRLLNADGQPISFNVNDRSTTVAKEVGTEEHFYGLGEKAAHLDKRRGNFRMFNSDKPGWKEGDDPLYQSIPFYIGLSQGQAYGLFYDNSYPATFDMASLQPQYAIYNVPAGPLDYYFMYGPSMRKVVARYTELTGRMPMPPRWALGHQQSRWSYYPARQVEDIVHHYRQDHLPLDVLHLDIHYMNGYRVFTWDPVGFPNPTQFVADLLKQGVHLVTIIDPGVKYQPASSPAPTPASSPELGAQEPHYYVYDEGAQHDFYVKHANGQPYIGRVWPGEAVFVDYTLDGARRWWGDLHRALVDHGVGGIWNDMNEPADFTENVEKAAADVVFDDAGARSGLAKNRNVFALLEARATYEGLQRLRPHGRPFVITRAGYAGIQRYSTMWTGDIASTWEDLSITLPMLETLGLSGETFVGTDIGGFTGRSNGELLTRWYQVGCLTPLCRNHHEINTYDQEPWRFGQPYEDIIRKYLQLRYRLMPYLYTVLEEAHRTGLPWFRPLVLNYQSDPNTYSLDDEFMVGGDLLAAPITAAHQHSREVYLPTGLWYDFWTEKPISGGRSITVEVPLDKLPLYVRGGAIIPMGPVMDFVDQIAKPPIDLVVYPDAMGRARGTYYWDDGVTTDYQAGKCERTTMFASQSSGQKQERLSGLMTSASRWRWVGK